MWNNAQKEELEMQRHKPVYKLISILKLLAEQN